MIRIPEEEALSLAKRHLLQAGANESTANSVAAACIDAQKEARTPHGFGHISVYSKALQEGRANSNPQTTLEWRSPVLVAADAGGGLPHPLFDQVYNKYVSAAHEFGLALFGLKGGFTCGALGYFTRRLADSGLVTMAFANGGPAVVAASGSDTPVFCTNPISFAFPQQDGPPLLIDQATSESALMNIRAASAKGEEIPSHWAVDANGLPTTNPDEALKGMLLAFGGTRGANIALMVELLAAGLNGAQWSIDAPSFAQGTDSLHVGLTIIAINPTLTFGPQFLQHSQRYFERLTHLNVHLPGLKSNEIRKESAALGIPVEADVLDNLRRDLAEH